MGFKSMRLDEWVIKNCRKSVKGQTVCMHGNRIEVINLLSEKEARLEATDENIKHFLEKNKTHMEIK